MDLSKSFEYFDPTGTQCTIIGCGSVGSVLAEQLARLGVPTIMLYDGDTVEGHNLANQNFVRSDIGKLKTQAVEERLKQINPDIKVVKRGWFVEHSTTIGTVFVAVDSIKVRKLIADSLKEYAQAREIFDIRMGLTSGTCYYFNKPDEMYPTLTISDEEIQEYTPVSACGTELSLGFVIVNTVTNAVAQFVNLNTQARHKPPKVIIPNVLTATMLTI